MLELLYLMLAAYRLTSDFTNEHGPFGLYLKIRNRVKRYVENEVDKTELELKDHHLYWLYDGIDCPICISFWMAFLVYFLPSWLVIPLAAAGGVRLIYYALGRLNR